MGASLTDVVDALQRHYGKPERPRITHPFELVLWENVAYLVNDERRAAVFRVLESKVGCTPQALLDVPGSILAELIEDGGMHAVRRADKLQKAADIALHIGLDVLRGAIKEDPAAAKRMLKKFPGFGEPGAEKVLLFNGAWKGLAPDSNALRVLLRVGFGVEEKDYARSYRSARAAVAPQLRDDPTWLIAAHQLLRRHGQELCKHGSPRCDECPLASSCRWHRQDGSR